MTQFISIIWIVLLFVVFYFLVLRPQQTRVKRHQELLTQLRVGDEVETIGGIQGKIISMEAGTMDLEIAPKVVVKVSKRAVSVKKDDIADLMESEDQPQD